LYKGALKPQLSPQMFNPFNDKEFIKMLDERIIAHCSAL
jgi:hypothetical protein